MSKAFEEHMKRINPTGVEWADMTEQQQLELREKWDAVVSVPDNLNCSCPRTGCRNNRNCRFCIALHRYYDCFTDCFDPLGLEMQTGIPPEKRFDMHTKMQSTNNPPEGIIDPSDPDGSRERLNRMNSPEQMRKVLATWDEVVRNPKNTACNCPRTDCWYHGNCVKCAALHRYHSGFPNCFRYLADEVEAYAEKYRQSI